MAQVADVTTKLMVGISPEAWAKWAAPVEEVSECELITGEFQWLSRASDAVLRVVSPGIGEFILILELQLYYLLRMPVRLRAYAGLAEEKYNLPVYPVLINLLRPGRGTQIPDRYESDFLGLKARQDFRVINAWELSAAEMLDRPDPALWPLTPLMDGGNAEAMLVRAKEQLRQNLQLKQIGRVEDMQAALATAASFVFNLNVFDRVFGGGYMDWVVESPLFKEIVRQREQVAHQQGLLEGREEGREELLTHLVTGRFGKLDDQTLKVLSDLSADRVNALAESFSSFNDREEFLAWLAQSARTGASAQNGEVKSS
jgi:predicted transposase YdaD